MILVFTDGNFWRNGEIIEACGGEGQ
jgi:hypothetical protein